VKRGRPCQRPTFSAAGCGKPRSLPYYTRLLLTRYPLTKLDLVAGAVGHSFGAMENWGAILFADTTAAVDPRVFRPRRNRQDAYSRSRRDRAMFATWSRLRGDDLWRNEGFATWMSHKGVESVSSGMESVGSTTNRCARPP